MRPVRFLLLVLLLPSLASAAAPSTEEQLRTHCLLHAADPRNPWALAHGICALGASYAASDGRRAADVIVGDFLQKGPDGGPTLPYGFARFEQDGTPVEPHTNLNVKTLVLSGLPLSTTFQAKAAGKVTLGQLVEGVKRGFVHVPQSPAYWADVGWTLDVLSALLKPGKAAIFTNGAGASVDFNRVMDDALRELERSQADLLAAMDAGQPEVAKRKQGIYAHSCGGLHLVQAVFHWARHPAVKKAWGKRLDRQVAVLNWRLGSERRQYEAALQAAPAPYQRKILVQMLKFYGHFLETWGRLRAEKTRAPSAADRQRVATARALLDDAVRRLQATGAFEQQAQLLVQDRQTGLDLLGDSCHAAHGMALTRW
jgi:hypothetical protein